MQPFPSTLARFVNMAGKIEQPWIQYIQQFTQTPPKFLAITVGSSPFSYTAVEPGYIDVTGGTVSAIHLLRGVGDINLTAQRMIPVSIGDIVKVTYSVVPTIQFIPIYGASPR